MLGKCSTESYRHPKLRAEMNRGQQLSPDCASGDSQLWAVACTLWYLQVESFWFLITLMVTKKAA